MNRRLAASIAFIAIIGTPALAADIARKAPPKAVVAAAPSWTGFYIGANAGVTWGLADDSSYSQPGGTIDPFDFGSSTKASAIGGLQVGYNWQLSPTWVIGLEGDFSWLSLKDNFGPRQVTVGGVPATTGGVPVTLTMNSTGDWLSSARGRIGYTWDTLMIYATGGVSWADIKYNGFMSTAPFSSVNTAFRKASPGWVAGGGIEKMIASNWLLRAEYLYYGLDSSQTSVAPCSACVPIPSGSPIAFHWGNAAIQVVRLGVSYKFQ